MRALAHRAGVAASCVVAGLAATCANAQARPASCRSGTTLFHNGRVRVFSVRRAFHDPSGDAPYRVLYVCRPGRRMPQHFYQSDPYTYFTPSNFHLFGRRLGFQLYEQGFSNGSETQLGWIDVLSGAIRLGAINDGENADPGDPLIPDDAVRYAIATDGAVALIGGTPSEDQQVAELPNGPHAFGRARVVFDAPAGRLAPRSIAIDATTISWRTTAGVAASAPR